MSRPVSVFLPFLLTGLLSGLAGCGGGWDASALGRPGGADGLFAAEKNFAKLINKYPKGEPVRTPWAGDYYPYTRNGITTSAGGSSGSGPASKYDSVHCNKTNSVGWEIKHHGANVKGVEGWWGHCNGWSVAAALYPEPRKNTVVNGVTFTAENIKALLTEAGLSASVDFYGTRVQKWTPSNDPAWEDIVPAQYFLIFTHYMGKLKHPVIVDRTTNHEVWNQPIAGYRIEYPKPEDYLGKLPDTDLYGIRFTSSYWYVTEDLPSETPEFRWDESTHPFVKVDLVGELWLDGPVKFKNGKIVESGDIVIGRKDGYIFGGKWMNGLVQPDFVWIPHSVIKPDPDVEQEDVNPHIDIDWLEQYLLPGGTQTFRECSDPTPPRPVPTASPLPSDRPTDLPTDRPTVRPTVVPNPPPGDGGGGGGGDDGGDGDGDVTPGPRPTPTPVSL